MQALYSRDGAYAVELGETGPGIGVGEAVHVFHVGADAKISRVTMYQASVV